MSDAEAIAFLILGAIAAIATAAALYYRAQLKHEIAADREEYWEIGHVIDVGTYYATIGNNGDETIELMLGTKVYIKLEKDNA